MAAEQRQMLEEVETADVTDGPLGNNENPIRLIRYKKVMIPNIPSRHT